MFNLTMQNCQFTEGIELVGEHEIGTKPIECHGCLTYLNCARLLHKIGHNLDGSIDRESNIKQKADMANKFVDQMDLEEHFVYLKAFESFVAKVSFLYSQRLIKERINDPAQSRNKSDEFRKALADHKLSQRPKKELKHLSDKEKAIKVLTDAGIPAEAAKIAIEEQFKAQGKVIS